MKATDLMIGDLVYASGKQIHITLATLNANIDVQPIPLTGEILNTNKFPYAPIAEGWFVGDLFLRGNEGRYSIGVNVRINDAGTGLVSDGMYYAFGMIRYVHEFQHLIRLLGIDKEIVL